MISKALDLKTSLGITQSCNTVTEIDFDKACSGAARNLHMVCSSGKLKESVDKQHAWTYLRAYIHLLQGCTDEKFLAAGKSVHSCILKDRYQYDIFLGNTLINMYCKCGSLIDATQMLNLALSQNVFTWTMLISAYGKHGHLSATLDLFQHMQHQEVRPNKVTFICVSNACASLSSLGHGKWTHSIILGTACVPDVFVDNSLIDMYSKCGSIESACHVFSRIHVRDVVSWNIVIAAYVQCGNEDEAFNLFVQMPKDGIEPDSSTFVCLLGACAQLASLKHGKQVHIMIVKAGYESNQFVKSALVYMYAKCGDIDCAHNVFVHMSARDLVSWTAIITGYVQNRDGNKALQLFQQMRQEGLEPDVVTYVIALNACSSIMDLDEGERIHANIEKLGWKSNILVGSALIDMYVKCGHIRNARQVFDRMSIHDAVSWTTMIAGYAQHGDIEESFKLFKGMQEEGVKANAVTFVIILGACARVAALEHGSLFHMLVLRTKCEINVSVWNSIIDMYAKCGSIDTARQLFDGLHERNVISWNVISTGYAQQGNVRESLMLFNKMQQEHLKPDKATFIAILTSCSSAGSIDEGHHYFSLMSGNHNVVPTEDLYTCLVDLLGRAGLLYEAEDLLTCIPFQPSLIICLAFLGACKVYGDAVLGRHAAEHVLKLDPQNFAALILLSNIYAMGGRWTDGEKLENLMEKDAMNGVETESEV